MSMVSTPSSNSKPAVWLPSLKCEHPSNGDPSLVADTPSPHYVSCENAVLRASWNLPLRNSHFFWDYPLVPNDPQFPLYKNPTNIWVQFLHPKEFKIPPTMLPCTEACPYLRALSPHPSFENYTGSTWSHFWMNKSVPWFECSPLSWQGITNGKDNSGLTCGNCSLPFTPRQEQPSCS